MKVSVVSKLYNALAKVELLWARKMERLLNRSDATFDLSRYVRSTLEDEPEKRSYLASKYERDIFCYINLLRRAVMSLERHEEFNPDWFLCGISIYVGKIWEYFDKSKQFELRYRSPWITVLEDTISIDGCKTAVVSSSHWSYKGTIDRSRRNPSLPILLKGSLTIHALDDLVLKYDIQFDYEYAPASAEDWPDILTDGPTIWIVKNQSNSPEGEKETKFGFMCLFCDIFCIYNNGQELQEAIPLNLDDSSVVCRKCERIGWAPLSILEKALQ